MRRTLLRLGSGGGESTAKIDAIDAGSLPTVRLLLIVRRTTISSRRITRKTFSLTRQCDCTKPIRNRDIHIPSTILLENNLTVFLTVFRELSRKLRNKINESGT
jgi:hypothetical protein